ncbi:PAS domain-containing sensor histidine kinase [Algoriphagus persicinus]|uniref:PAS domain-containing sensor histidine kinase n=1 Tax=Algoriphagus persicinus TaxID=3108754 RepID=UPI002B3C03CE|nr:PAS domain S-box protein [Algoriphagus sp. E1-3-M2]MEB2787358.1 PAS domain S-box protein [Algoriphagus sp. E1-3-M2]
MQPSNLVLQKLFEDSSDGILICDKQGKIIHTNPAIKSIFGYSPQELEGSPIEVLLPKELQEIHKSHLHKYATKPSSRLMSDAMKLSGLRKDGSEVFLSISLTPLKNDENKELFIATVRDVHEIIIKSEELEVTSKRLKEALKISKLGYWDFNIGEDKLIWSNEVFEIFELDPKSFIPSNENFLKLVHPEDRNFVESSFNDSVLNQIPYNIVHRYITPNGELKFLRERGSNYYTNAGKIYRTTGSVQDVTEVQKQKLILNEYILKTETKNKELENFAHITAHDLQEPLNNIIGLLELFRSEITNENSNTTERDYYLELVLKASLKMKSLIKGLMETSRLGSIDKIRKVDCKEVVEEVIQTLHSQIKKYHATIEIKALPIVEGYPFELNLLFQNLLSNALKYSQKNIPPKILVSSHDQGSEWLFMVEDNGIGIDSIYKNELFKMFRRLPTESKVEGTGIGLAQCKKIIELHQGSIWFESKPRRGTVFYFTLRKPSKS